MKKILLLGGSAQQVVAIETAKRLGYYAVLCDYLPDNPGQYVADKFYLVSTTDKEAILKVAQDEAVDGALAYASDPAAPTAAYVAEKLGLPSNPLRAVETLCNKDMFRKFLADNGFNAPTACGYSDSEVETALQNVGAFRLPVIVKPTDSSGSKGATVLRDWAGFRKALEFAFSFSRCKRVVVEEFIEKKHKYLIGGDIFIQDGEVVQWGLLNCHRDASANPLVPVGKSYPPELDAPDLEAVKETLRRMVAKLGIRFGAMNVELAVDGGGRVWPIDVGPRNGGNMIPDLLGMIFGVDVVEATVKAAMGEPFDFKANDGVPFYATHNLHSIRAGAFERVEFSPEIERRIVRINVYKREGDPVEFFDNASKALGIVFLKFETAEEMSRILGAVDRHIKICVKN